MKYHAYLITAHNEPEALKLLLELIDDERNNIYVHIDQRSTSLYKEEIKGWCSKSKINFIAQEKVYWSGYSLVNITINLLKVAISENNSYYHSISGVDLPLKTQDEFHDFFEKHSGKEFISTGRITTWKIASRYKYYYFEKWTEVLSRKSYRIARVFIGGLQAMLFIDRTRNSNLEYHMGGNWFSITHNLATYIIEKEIFIRKNFDFGFCTDEIFLSTLVMNSLFKSKVSPMMNLRYVDWNRGNPYIWQKQDFEELTSNNIFFARKFSYESHPEIMEKIKDHLTL